MTPASGDAPPASEDGAAQGAAGRPARVWIEAAPAGIRVFGMGLLERLLRALLDAGVEPTEIRVATTGTEDPLAGLPSELAERLPLVVDRATGPFVGRLQRAWESGSGPVIVLPGDAIVDARLLAHLVAATGNVAFVGESEHGVRGVLRLESDGTLASAENPTELAQQSLRGGLARSPADTGFDGYIDKLRRELAPYVLAVPDEAARKQVERWLFWSNYKGSTDFLTKYVYPPFVWLLVRPLARWRVHPNWVTAVDILATVAAIPFFVAGQWLPGLALAYLMSVLDSVDGKLARLTYTSSKIGDWMDHGLDIVHPPFWYLAWAYPLAQGDTGAPVFQAAVWLFVVYVLDRLVAPAFKWRTGRSIHGYRPLDERMRTFISRRNVNLPVFTLALGIDALSGGQSVAVIAFYFIAGWQVASFVWHLARLVRFWNHRPDTVRPA
ncbi:MAG: CDP-alcohol phosphatidyltransferase family protein [Proteobacteria bacterium]|nr:CDP-alcohol phosphatidyltransferase family protein [Pseudomonadota bacterium]